MADRDSGVIIMPDGTFRKCEHYLGNQPLGDLKQGWTDWKALDGYRQSCELDECQTCALEPGCYHLACCTDQKQCFESNRKDKFESVVLALKHRLEIWQKNHQKSEDETIFDDTLDPNC